MPQPHHYCSAGWKIGAHLPDDCAGGRDREDSCKTAQQAGRKVRGYKMTTLLAGIHRDSCTTALLAGREGRGYKMTILLPEIDRNSCTTAQDDYTAGRERETRLHDDGTAGRDRKG